MRILDCIAFQHDWRIVVLAVLMCLLGSTVSVTLIRRAMGETGSARFHWIALSAVTAGAGTWATHFIAMLGYDARVPIAFDGTLTIVSALLAVFGIAIGLVLANVRSRVLAIVAGGGMVGVSIAAMHYTGMLAYRTEGIVRWLPEYVIGSIVAVTVLGMAFIACFRAAPKLARSPLPVAVLIAAIVSLHFTGMAGFVLTPLPGVGATANADVYLAMASAIAVVALLVLGTGISTHLLERKTYSQSQDELEHIAMHDALTELANRHNFTIELEKECRRLEQTAAGFALLMVDLDRFKPVNDTLGHPAGDFVLQKVADRLRKAVRGEDLVARIGGDEFAIILREVSDVETIEAIAARVVEILSRPFLVHGNIAELGGSVGVAIAPKDGTVAEELIGYADVALYTAKHEGRERFHLFHPDLMEGMQRRRQLEAAIRRACTLDDFVVHYQPVFDPRTNSVTGAEALLRWTCEERGEVSPAEFVPIAEELGLISRIGAGVLEQACRDAATWKKDLTVAVNISPVQLLDPRLPQTVSNALEEAGLEPHRLEIEITETALLGNFDQAHRCLTRLDELGVNISLDDFGTGYSSLSYLHRFPIDRIKIDRSFVKLLPEDAGSSSIVRAISQLGANLGLEITVEGIETQEQYDFIVENNCGNVQGFLISRPVPAAALKEFLDKSHSATAA